MTRLLALTVVFRPIPLYVLNVQVPFARSSGHSLFEEAMFVRESVAGSSELWRSQSSRSMCRTHCTCIRAHARVSLVSWACHCRLPVPLASSLLDLCRFGRPVIVPTTTTQEQHPDTHQRLTIPCLSLRKPPSRKMPTP